MKQQSQGLPADVPAQLGCYRVIRKVGEGGMGVVYEAVQGGLDRRVALKLLSKVLTRDPEYIERFKREAKVAAGLNHRCAR